MADYFNVTQGAEQKSPAETQVVEEKKTNDGAEYTLKLIANVILVAGIIATLICLFTLVFSEEPSPGYRYATDTAFNASGFVTTVMVLFATLISWSTMHVLANISSTLKEILKAINK